MPFSVFSPVTIRKSSPVRKRLQSQKRKAYDKYKLVQEQAEGAKFKAKTEAIRDSSSSRITEDYRGTFYFESVRENTDENDEDKTSSIATLEMQFKKKHLLNRLCNKLLGKTGKWELKIWQFLIITFTLHFPLAYAIQHVIVVNIWGATLVLFVYVITEIIIAIPIYVAYIFLGNYGRRAHVSFWNCVPLFKGMAYSVAATAIIYELLNVSFTSLSLLYLKDVIIAKPPWISCKFPNSHPDCVPMYAKHEPYTVKCCDEDDKNCSTLVLKQCLKYGAFDYYVSHVLQEGYESISQKNGLQWKWVVAVVIDWFLIYVLLCLGLRRYVSLLTILNIAMLICLFIPGFFVTSFMGPKFSLTSHAKGNLSFFFDYNFWIQTSVHTLHKETPGDVITFSSLTKSMLNVTTYTVVIYSIKVLMILMFTVWCSMFVFSVQKHYKVEDSFCIRSRGDYLIFAVIPDVISRWPLHQLLLPFYFFNLFLWGLSTTTYVLSSFLEAFLEEFPGILKLRFIVTTVLCAVLGTANVFLMRPNFMNVYCNITSNVFVYVKTAQLFISMVALFIYSLDRFKNDYHFKCGIILENYLINGFKIAFLVLSVLLFLVYALRVSHLTPNNAYFIIGLLSPILIAMMITTFRYFLKLRPTLLDPDPKWGPIRYQRRLARSRFDASEDLHFRSTSQICKHNCLIPSVALRKEIKHRQSKQIVRISQLTADQESN